VAHPEQLAKLAEGVEAWNRWRASHEFAPDLTAAPLTNRDLSGADLRGADLREADFNNTLLSGANLREAALQGVDLSVVHRGLQTQQFAGADPNGLIFRSRRNTPLLETNVLHDGLHPALKALGLPKAGLHAFRRGCNRRWELSGLNPAVIRQQMGHSSERMTTHYTGQIPLEEVKAAFSKVQLSSKSGNKIVVLENVENEPAV